MTFDQLYYLTGGRHIDYPHVMEHGDSVYIAHSGGKRSVEIQRVRLADLNAMRMPR
jgi:hypothetical protein